MHLAIKVVGQSAVVVQSTQIGATDVAHLQFLMSARARGVRERFQFAFLLLLGRLGSADLVEFCHGRGDAA